MRMIDAESDGAQATGLTIHRLGDSLVLDRSVYGNAEGNSSESEPDDDYLNPLVLLPRSLLEEVCENGGLKRSTALIDVKNTFLHIPNADEDAHLPRYHSAPPGGYTDPPSLHVSPPRPIKDNMMTGLLRLPLSSPVCSRSAEAMLPFLRKDNMSPMSRMNRAVEWNIAGFTVLLGCEIVLMETSNKSMLPLDFSSVRELRGNEFWPSKPDAREAWLETNLLQIEKVAWIDRQRESVELMTSSSELCLEADVTGMLNSIRRVLSFLHTECTKQGATYCLVRGSDGCCHLYDVTELPNDCNVLQVSQDLAVPIAKLCYSIVSADSKASKEDKRRLLQKGWDLIKSDSQGKQELVALMAIELASLTTCSEKRIELLLHAVHLCKERYSDSSQKLLVTTVTAIAGDDNQSIALLNTAHELLSEISEERRSVECKGIELRLNSLLGRALVRGEGQTAAEPKIQRLKRAITLLSDAKDIEWEATALNELGAILILESTEEAIQYLTQSLLRFSEANVDETKRHLLSAAAVINLCKAFKKLSLEKPYNIRDKLIVIALALVGQKLSRSIVPESAVGMELFGLGTALVGERKIISKSENCELVEILSKILNSKSSVIGKAFAGITKRKLGSTGLCVGDIEMKADVDSVELATSCLDLSLLYVTEQDRTWLRPQVDFHIARLIVESGGESKEALRHINKVLSAEEGHEWMTEALCLKATILFKLEEAKKAILTLVGDSLTHPAIMNCLKTICMHDIKSQNPYPKSKPILEAILRKQTADFITAIVRS
jgi:hypothetical protein